MATITLKGSPVNTNGNLPSKGLKAPEFQLAQTDLSTLSLSDLKGKRLILNIFPSLDTSICGASVRRFNKEAANLKNTVVLAISKDLPFAHARFCTIEGIENVKPLSAFRNSDFENKYGVLMVDGPLQGLFARSIVAIDESGNVIYNELVPEITHEPDYSAVIAHLQ